VKYLFLSLSVAFNVGSYGLYKLISGRTTDWIWVTLFSAELGLGNVNMFFFTGAIDDERQPRLPSVLR